MMNRFFTLLLAASCLTAVGQVTYPYNPDEDGNGQIAVADLQGILSTYGNAFSPSEILVDGETLTTVLTQLQNSIDSLSGLTGGGGSVLDMPLGTVLPIATESVPEGWMLCDGREISIEDYQGLYDLIGTTYGAGDSAFWAQVFYPATTFNIPDLRGRTIIGANDMGGEQSEVIVNHSAQRGQSGGAEMHQLVESELPVVSFPVLSFQPAGPDLVNNGSTPVAETQFQFGADEPHNNMQPYMALNYMMKVEATDNILSELTNRVAELEEQLSDQLIWDTLFFTGCNAQIDYSIDSTPVDFLVVQGATFEENTLIGCVENGYSLSLNSCLGCPNGHVLTIISDLPGYSAPFLEIFSPLELHDQWGGKYALEYLWAGEKWFKLSVD